ncbi:MAG: DUF2058 domain-containing protein [Desulfobacula sp.]|nr:DUF2058 domain-containing protein [Desulfobacula sp.]
MGISLKDQLLKAGLVNKKQVKKARHDKRVKQKKNKGNNSPGEINKTQQEQSAKEKCNRELNQQLNKEKLKREKLAQVRQLIETNRLKLDDYEDPYYFAVGKKIKKIYINEEITRKLSFGQLAIVKFDNLFEIVPVRVAGQIATRDPDALVVLHKPEK